MYHIHSPKPFNTITHPPGTYLHLVTLVPFVVDVHVAFRLAFGVGGDQPVQVIPLQLVGRGVDFHFRQLLLDLAHLLQLLWADILRSCCEVYNKG